MELIKLEDIHKTYHLGEVDVPVLKGISLTREANISRRILVINSNSVPFADAKYSEYSQL